MIPSKLNDFRKKYGVPLLAVLLSIYTLPQSFFFPPGGALDGSWTRAMNMAVKNHFVFGRDIVFSYGPLAFLNTRNGEYISNFFLFAGDMFLLYGFYHIFRKYLSQYKGWFFILLCGMLCIKGSSYSQSLFLLFTIFSAFCFNNNFRNYFELIYCAIAGIVLFFIKVNYGIITIFILSGMAVFMLIKNRKALVVFAVVSVVMFGIICFYVRIDPVNYIRYSIPMIEYYNEAMFLEMPPTQTEFISAAALISAFLVIVFVYIVDRLKQKKFVLPVPITAILFCIACFLFYKNGFTRCDYGHYSDFYSVFPLFVIFVLFIAGYGATHLARIVCVCIIFVSFINLKEFPINYDTLRLYVPHTFYTSIVDYWSGIFSTQEEIIPREIFSLKIPDDKLKLIGNTTIDIIPEKIIMLQVNNLNYDPRPVIQSYSAYSEVLDSLNANHFYQQNRPKMVLINTGGVDHRYFAWDESLTKATLHLNYTYSDYLSFNSDSLSAGNPNAYILLKSKNEAPNWPRFEKISEVSVGFNDTVKVNFPDSVAVYMTVDIEYSGIGNMEKIFFHPPLFGITMLLDNGTSESYRLIRPIACNPVLINKFIGNNIDLKNFIAGDIKENVNITGFALHVKDVAGVKQKMKISFLKFSNY